jgi:hypothetical protein
VYSDIIKLERIVEEVVMVYFKVLPNHSPGLTGENHEDPESG